MNFSAKLRLYFHICKISLGKVMVMFYICKSSLGKVTEKVVDSHALLNSRIWFNNENRTELSYVVQ